MMHGRGIARPECGPYNSLEVDTKGHEMIEVTQLSGKVFWVNPHQIEYIEANPDTTLIMLSGKRIILRETAETVIDKIVAYRKRIGGFRNEE